MKSKFFFTLMALLMVLCSYSFAQVPQLINYQGKLTSPSGAPVNATVQMVFSIYADAGGTTLLWRETQTAVVVDKGVFNVLLGSVDPVNNPIPYSIFDGSTRYLGVKVGGDPDEILPRKPIVSVAYAYKSFEADTADFARSGGGGNDWIIDASDGDTTLFTGGAWGIARYGNILYGNADSTHVNLGVACTTGTSGQNYNYCTVGGGFRNAASGYAATVGGGDDNTASSWSATAGGGHLNTASGSHATVGGGEHNAASGDHATVGGGDDNTASGADAAVGGGESNSASGWLATVGGGYYDTASGYTSTIGGGYYNTVTNSQGTIAGGGHNYASGGQATIAGGYYNTAGPYHYSTVGGGERNTASAYYSTVPGGYGDTASGYCSFAAGYQVRVDADYTFAFGNNFTTSASHAVIFYDSGTPIKVGIGTTSPSTTLHVQGDALVKSTGGSVSLSGSDGAMEIWGTDGAFIDLKDSESDDYDFRITQVGGTNNLGLLGGNVGIGHTSPTEKLDVNGTARLRSMSTGTGTDVVVDANGVLLKKSSSIRYKQNIRRLDSTPGQILQLNPVRFDWKTTGEADIGLIAEEVEKAVPDLVIYDKEGKPDAVKYDKMTVYLLQVVKAQQEQIDVLKAKLDQLESNR
jgi:hypothetical protein